MEQQGISKLDLKRQNRMQILKLLKQQGPTSRINIAAVLQLTRAAVTIITNEMIEQGIVCEVGEQKNLTKKVSRGRKKILVDINHNYKFVLGVLADEEQISVGLSTLDGSVLDKRNLMIAPDEQLDPSAQYDKLFGFVTTAIGEIMSYNCLENSAILGLGIAIMPEIAHHFKIQIRDDGRMNFDGMKSALSEHIHVPMVFTDATTAMAMACVDFNRTKSLLPQNVVLIHYGNYLSSVILEGNEPIRPQGAVSNQIENILIRGERTRDLITPQAVIGKARALLSAQQTPALFKLANGEAGNIAAPMLQEAYNAGDLPIVSLLDQACEDALTIINNFFCIVRPDTIYIQGCELCYGFMLDMLISKATRFLGPEKAALLVPGAVDSKQRFLGGCSAAIRALFFTKGGYR